MCKLCCLRHCLLLSIAMFDGSAVTMNAMVNVMVPRTCLACSRYGSDVKGLSVAACLLILSYYYSTSRVIV